MKLKIKINDGLIDYLSNEEEVPKKVLLFLCEILVMVEFGYLVII